MVVVVHMARAARFKKHKDQASTFHGKNVTDVTLTPTENQGSFESDEAAIGLGRSVCNSIGVCCQDEHSVPRRKEIADSREARDTVDAARHSRRTVKHPLDLSCGDVFIDR